MHVGCVQLFSKKNEQQRMATKPEGFRVGDIVWLRLVGFSWWPAKIISEETWPGLAAEQGNNDTLARFYNEHIDSALFVSYIITNWLRLLINFFAKFLVGLKKNRN